MILKNSEHFWFLAYWIRDAQPVFSLLIEYYNYFASWRNCLTVIKNHDSSRLWDLFSAASSFLTSGSTSLLKDKISLSQWLDPTYSITLLTYPCFQFLLILFVHSKFGYSLGHRRKELGPIMMSGYDGASALSTFWSCLSF